MYLCLLPYLNLVTLMQKLEMYFVDFIVTSGGRILLVTIDLTYLLTKLFIYHGCKILLLLLLIQKIWHKLRIYGSRGEF